MYETDNTLSASLSVANADWSSTSSHSLHHRSRCNPRGKEKIENCSHWLSVQRNCESFYRYFSSPTPLHCTLYICKVFTIRRTRYLKQQRSGSPKMTSPIEATNASSSSVLLGGNIARGPGLIKSASTGWGRGVGDLNAAPLITVNQLHFLRHPLGPLSLQSKVVQPAGFLSLPPTLEGDFCPKQLRNPLLARASATSGRVLLFTILLLVT